MSAPEQPSHHPCAQNIDEMFNQHGLRCTRQRRAIYDVLAASTSHPTADQIFRSVSPHISGLSLATVYNTLEAFCKCGLARRLSPRPDVNGSARYDAASENHLHVRCQQSGRIYDVPQDLGRKVLDHIPRDVLHQIESRLGIKVSDVHVEFIATAAGQACNSQ